MVPIDRKGIYIVGMEVFHGDMYIRRRAVTLVARYI